ncbi:MAG: HlyC/CorC family transporter [Proteobacteria bacterium]|nr:MAG: HlyC/CorC family transporter [Pseudomonadota bacterium]
MTSDIIIVLLLIFANAFFTISDMSVIAAKKTRMQSLADDGNKRAKSILSLVDDPTPVIATTQIGLTVITMLEGAFVEASLSGKVAAWFQQLGIFATNEKTAASVIVFVIVTFLLLLIGDILPKRIAILYPEKVSTALAPIINLVIKLLLPIITSFTFLSDSILRFFGLSTKRSEEVSEEDIETMIEAGAQSGVLVQAERDLFENVWRLDESKVGSLMTTRSDIVYIDVTASPDENLDKILSNPSQNLLVCKESLDHVLGYIPAIHIIKEVLTQFKETGISIKTNWTEGLQPIHAIPNTLTLIEILEAFRTYKSHLALVYNEFGHVDGLVTIGDLVTAVMGDIQSLNPDGDLIEKDNSGKWLVDGQAPINDLLSELEIDELPDGDHGSYQTAAGFVISIIGRQEGRLPKVFDKFNYEGYVFEVVDIDRDGGYRVDKIMVRREEQVDSTISELI